METKWLKNCLMFVIILILTACIASCGHSESDGIQLFTKEDVNNYSYGVVYSYHNVDAVVQLYSSNGTLLNTTTLENVRACGLCSSSAKPFIKFNEDYYFVSDAVFDPSLKNCIIRIDPQKVKYKHIEIGMPTNYAYNFSIDPDENTISAYYSGQPEWGCIYEISMKEGNTEYFAFSELENFSNVIPENAHFWPLDAIILDDYNYYIGYITDSYNRTLSIARVVDRKFELLCSLNGYLYADGSLYDGNNIFISVYSGKDDAQILRYNVESSVVDASLSLEYRSTDVDIHQQNSDLVIVNCDLEYSEQQRKVIYASDRLQVKNTYNIAQPLRMYDFKSDKIVCTDKSSIYVYDYTWNEIASFKLVQEPDMKFSGIFSK